MVQKFLTPGKVVILLNGRFAGRKAVILHNFDDGTDDRKYGHAIVAGIDRYPKKVTRRMSKRVTTFKTRIKPFVKTVNYSHMMPTRYHLDSSNDSIVSDLQKIVTPETVVKGRRAHARRQVKSIFQRRHRAGQNRWFFTRLRF
mmetsp:Transcript_8282/g.12590  ORF Transcript_8282/g.12590 Transcript_8282/m.12590 type:complete len:143 (+) Transcript_8282:138-566(+)